MGKEYYNTFTKTRLNKKNIPYPNKDKCHKNIQKAKQKESCEKNNTDVNWDMFIFLLCFSNSTWRATTFEKALNFFYDSLNFVQCW